MNRISSISVGLVFLITLVILVWPQTQNQLVTSFPPTALVSDTHSMLPPQSSQAIITPSIIPSAAPDKPILSEVNLPVPFTSQAPTGRWDKPFQEYCEEAAVLMVYQYLTGKNIAGTTNVIDSLRLIQAYEESVFGSYQDTTAAQTAKILSDLYKISNVSLVANPTDHQLKEFLNLGKPIIVPTAGRLLGNPHFTQPGPVYHMIVIKGYTSDGRYITNDPGTKHGADYLYDSTIILNAIHDWNNGNVEFGAKVVIVADKPN